MQQTTRPRDSHFLQYPVANQYTYTVPTRQYELKRLKKALKEVQALQHRFFDLPFEIICVILAYLNVDGDRCNASRSCSIFARAIREVVGVSNVFVGKETLVANLPNYKGILTRARVKATYMKNGYFFKGVKNIDLQGCKHVTDEDVKWLGGVHTINLSRCYNVTDESIKRLGGVHTIDLRGTKVTDIGLKALAGVHTIQLGRTNITDDGITALAGVHTIALTWCRKITDAGVKALAGVHTINLSNNIIADSGIKALSGVHKINLFSCQNISDEGVKALAGVHTITLAWCRNISDVGVRALAGVHTIDLRGTSVTPHGMSALEGAHTIYRPLND